SAMRERGEGLAGKLTGPGSRWHGTIPRRRALSRRKDRPRAACARQSAFLPESFVRRGRRR
ncbi:MAG: hypothetical protein ACK559_02295, partial [bacterium]